MHQKYPELFSWIICYLSIINELLSYMILTWLYIVQSRTTTCTVREISLNPFSLQSTCRIFIHHYITCIILGRWKCCLSKKQTQDFLKHCMLLIISCWHLYIRRKVISRTIQLCKKFPNAGPSITRMFSKACLSTLLQHSLHLEWKKG